MLDASRIDMFSSKAVEVVDITNDRSITVNMTSGCKLELEGIPKSQARPRRDKGGAFHNPNGKDEAAFNASFTRS